MIAVFLVIIFYLEKYFTFFLNMMVLLTSFLLLLRDHRENHHPWDLNSLKKDKTLQSGLYKANLYSGYLPGSFI